MPNRILIVDDEPLNLDLLDQELAEMGHVTERATDGSEALAKLIPSIQISFYWIIRCLE
jgi:CheY-like chemotaxis protein